MDGAIASFAVNKLGDLLIEQGKLLVGVEDQVRQMQTQITRMKCFLGDVHGRQDGNEQRIINCIAEIAEVAYDAEDAVETYVVEVAYKKRSGGNIGQVLKRYACILREVSVRFKLGSDISAINFRISDITRTFSTYEIDLTKGGEGSSSTSMYQRRRELRWSYSHVEEEDVVGLEKDTNQLAALLVNDKKNIAIWGMGGIGKTTLAKEVYRHRAVRRHFDCFAWICVSQQMQRREVLQGILLDFLPYERKEILELRDEEMVKKIYQFQEDKKCLVVLDDIWEVEAWNSLSPAFPNRNKSSKILLTTRNKEVALKMGRQIFVHELKLLTEEESLQLFWKKASPRPREDDAVSSLITTDMEDIGRKIAAKCEGLPLSITVLGGLLATKSTFNDWEMVHRQMSLYLRGGKDQMQQGGGILQILALSYNDMPFYLKPCFLYLGLFPEDHEIPIEKLVRMWVAEGLVSSINYEADRPSMVDVAKGYLDELVERCMVQVGFTKLSGRLKFCRLHDIMRELCLKKASEENFFQHFHFRHLLLGNFASTSSSPSLNRKIRRLAIDIPDRDEDVEISNKLGNITGQLKQIRSVIVFGGSWTFPQIKFLKSFDLLRVLDFEGIFKCNGHTHMKLPSAIRNLVHLRYLSLRNNCFHVLPSSMSNLRLLQTLDLRNFNCRIPNVLWKMKELTHLYFPYAYTRTSKKNRLRLDELSNLETLANFNSRECDINCLLKLTNLLELKDCTIRVEELGKLPASWGITSADMNSKNYCLRYSSFHIEGNIHTEEEQELLRKLLWYRHLCKLELEGPLVKLPEHHLFPQNLTLLWLDSTKLEEDPMPTLEKLAHLRFLLLLKHAYIGKEMVCSAPIAIDVGGPGGRGLVGFPQLKRLHLLILENLETWRVDEGAMPNLIELKIVKCNNLKGVPDGLIFTTKLKDLHIGTMPQEFCNKLREGGEDFYKVQHVPSIRFRNYKWFKPRKL